MPQSDPVSRRDFLGQSILTAGAVGAVAAAGVAVTQAAPPNTASNTPPSNPASPSAQNTGPKGGMPCGQIGKVKISRLLVGGNLIGGWMHARDLKYVNHLFRAYVTEQKLMETLALAEQNGINTVFETGAKQVERYNKEYSGKMQFIPHIEIKIEQTEAELKDHIKAQVDSGACALYTWGVSSDRMIMGDRLDLLKRAVELAKKHDLPVGVGSHSLTVTQLCEKNKVPCDFYVKTLHSDKYPSATPKEQRKDFMWHTGAPGYYDNMWCINPEETIEFMKTVDKPWIAFKVLAAGAFVPHQGFDFALKGGADFMAVGMFDFQIKENAATAARLIRENQKRERPWRA